MNRRGFLLGGLGLLAAPAIVRVSAIMPVKAMPPEPQLVQALHAVSGFRDGEWWVFTWADGGGDRRDPAAFDEQMERLARAS
jgi:hypothetical protein